jgi:hypothetical protein
VTQLGADNKEKPIMLRWNLLTNYLLWKKRWENFN